MTSPPDDRTARARIRDEALRSFGERGPDAVTVRDVAAAAGVSPALVMRHFRSRDGLREAVDEHVTRLFEAVLADVVEPEDGAALPATADLVAARFAADPAVGAYLGRLLVVDGPVGSALFRRLYDVSVAALERMAAAGTARAGDDPAARAAFLLVNDLAVLILRDRVREVLGVDPLSAAGLRRWGAEVTSVYRDGLAGPPPDGERGGRR